MNTLSIIYIFGIVWVSFNLLFYIIKKTFKCHDTLIPIISFSFIILTLNTTGIFLGSLKLGFYLILFVLFNGLYFLIISEKFNFVHTLLKFDFSIHFFFIIVFALLLQSFLFSNNFIQPDEIHHWGFIVKGMINYDTIDGFKNSYANYTVGGALWAYFIHKLVGSDFSISLALWSNTIVTTICLLPALRLFAIKKTYGPVIVISFFLLILGNSLLQIIGLFIFVLASTVSFLKNNLKLNISIFSLMSYLLFFAFLSLMPGYEFVSYRTMTPDHIIFVIPAAIFGAYISKPTFKTLLLISPAIALAYLFKRPGNFLSFSVFICCLLHCIFLHFNLVKAVFLNPIKFRKYSIYILFIIIFNSFFLIIPSVVWSNYCIKNNRTSMFEFNNTSKSLNELFRPIYSTEERCTLVRKNFYNKICSSPLFLINYQSQFWKVITLLPLHLKKAFLKQNNNNFLTFILLSIIIIICLIILLFFEITRQHKLYIIILPLLLFYFLYILGVFLNYVFNFPPNELFLPAFERYISPIAKLSLLLIFLLYIYCCVFSNDMSTALIISILLFILSFKIYNLCDRSFHTVNFEQPYLQSGKLLSHEIPDNLNLKDKKILLISSSKLLTDPIRDFYICAALLNHNGTLPINFTRLNIYNPKFKEILNKTSFDYLWIHDCPNFQNYIDSSNIKFSNFKIPNETISNEVFSVFYEFRNNSFNLLKQYPIQFKQ